MSEFSLHDWILTNQKHHLGVTRMLIHQYARGVPLHEGDIYQSEVVQLLGKHHCTPFTEEPNGLFFLMLRQGVSDERNRHLAREKRRSEIQPELVAAGSSSSSTSNAALAVNSERTEITSNNPLDVAMAECDRLYRRTCWDEPLPDEVIEAVEDACLLRIAQFNRKLTPRQREVFQAWFQALGSRRLAMETLGAEQRGYDGQLNRLRPLFEQVLHPHQTMLRRLFPPEQILGWYAQVFEVIL